MWPRTQTQRKVLVENLTTWVPFPAREQMWLAARALPGERNGCSSQSLPSLCMQDASLCPDWFLLLSVCVCTSGRSMGDLRDPLVKCARHSDTAASKRQQQNVKTEPCRWRESLSQTQRWRPGGAGHLLIVSMELLHSQWTHRTLLTVIGQTRFICF